MNRKPAPFVWVRMSTTRTAVIAPGLADLAIGTVAHGVVMALLCTVMLHGRWWRKSCWCGGEEIVVAAMVLSWWRRLNISPSRRGWRSLAAEELGARCRNAHKGLHHHTVGLSTPGKFALDAGSFAVLLALLWDFWVMWL
jgi:hypothetical protein